MADVRESLLEVVNDQSLIDYFYLNCESGVCLVNSLKNIKFEEIGNDKNVPFMAKIRGYTGAVDSGGESWLIKEVEDKELIIAHLLEEFAYCVDNMMSTLAAPTILIHQDGKYYRATKQINSSMQIGSYNYLESPFKRVLTNDLINRWLFFDEDRNPNNYLVIHNSKNVPLVVAIDYNKVDLLTKDMKISGDPEKFGWFREEKTRFLTLLKPSNFENLSIKNFDRRLTIMMEMDTKELLEVCRLILDGIAVDAEKIAKLAVSNIDKRRKYIDEYFRTWFTEEDVSYEQEQNDRYSAMGASFMNYHKKGM